MHRLRTKGWNLLDHHRVFDAGNHFHGATAFPAGFDVNVEHPFQALRPRHAGTTFGRRLRIIRSLGLVALAPLSGRHHSTVLAIGGKYTMTKSLGMILDSFSWPTKWVGIRDDTNKSCQIHARLWHQGGQSCDEIQRLTKSPGAILNSRRLARRV